MVDCIQAGSSGGIDVMASNSELHVAEAAAAAGISKPTLLRWIKDGKVDDAKKRDRNGWRIFSSDEVARIQALAASTKPVVKS